MADEPKVSKKDEQKSDRKTARTLISIPPSPKKGERIEIRALIQHPMQTGYLRGGDGAIIPRDLVRRFSCHFQAANSNAESARELVIDAELHPAIAANPYFSFYILAQSSGSLIFSWSGDNAFSQTETVAFNVA